MVDLVASSKIEMTAIFGRHGHRTVVSTVVLSGYRFPNRHPRWGYTNELFDVSGFVL